MRAFLCMAFLLGLASIAIATHAWRVVWTWGKPQPVVGDVWCRDSDADPFTDPGLRRRYVLAMQDGWVQYAIGTRHGWERSSEVWLFRAHSHPCLPDEKGDVR